MDTHQAQSLLPDYSADNLDAPTAAQVRRFLAECPDCKREWEAMQSTLLTVSALSQPVPTPAQSSAMWSKCAEKLHASIEAERLAAQRPAWRQWLGVQPRWGWAALGGAVAVLGSVWLMGPQNAPVSPADNSNPGQLVAFQQPPAMASTLVNHHSAMAFDPFTDHVGSTLVSYSATAPESSR